MTKGRYMEIEQLIQQIFASTTNQIAATVILCLTCLALIGTFTQSNAKIKNFTYHSPAILATVGIFFSFWGISIGLIALDLTDIQGSIPKLLDGLKVKFIASLMGIGASIVVRIAQNFSTEEIEESGSDEKIIHLLSDIRQSLAVKDAANTDTLFLELKNALIEIDENNERRSNQLNQALTSQFEHLSQAFKNFADQMAKTNTESFIQALEEAMKSFNNNTTEQFGENFKELNRAVGAMLEWQKNYKSHVETLSDNFEAACHSVDTIQSAFSDIQDRAEKIVSTPVELNDVLEKIELRLEELNEYLKTLKEKKEHQNGFFEPLKESFKSATADNMFKDRKPENMSDAEKSTQEGSGVVVDDASAITIIITVLGVMYIGYLIFSWLFK
jgi:chaperonin cofactor prefoldin